LCDFIKNTLANSSIAVSSHSGLDEFRTWWFEIEGDFIYDKLARSNVAVNGHGVPDEFRASIDI
jgi:hypothetical protein